VPRGTLYSWRTLLERLPWSRLSIVVTGERLACQLETRRSLRSHYIP